MNSSVELNAPPLPQMRNNKKTAILVKEVNPKKRLFLVYRPNTGRQLKLETYVDIKKKFKKVWRMRSPASLGLSCFRLFWFSAELLQLIFPPASGLASAFTAAAFQCLLFPHQVLSEDAKQHWTDQYTLSAKICSHAYWWVPLK